MSSRVRFASLVAVCALAACRQGAGNAGGPGPGGPGGGRPAMPVEATTLAEAPVEQATEFIATLKSRRSTTIQPQVEGFVTRIAVRSGQRVKAGDVLFEVDSGRQQAAVAMLESMRSMRAADVQYAEQQAQRSKTLFQAGAVSQRDLEQADTAVRTSAAQLQAVDQQIREQLVELGYYKVTAPSGGTVGDVPIRQGDRVTKSTVLTTVDDNDALEFYVSVPVQQAPDLRLGLPLRVIDDRGQIIATNRLTFIAPSVDEATQSVLAKAQLIEGRGQFRADQSVRVRLVWRAAPGLVVPVTAVTRVSGQYFVFVADGAGDAVVARQRAVRLGDLIGNNYLVVDGLKAGDRLITSGIQKIGDGAPVRIGAPAPAPAPQKAS